MDRREFLKVAGTLMAGLNVIPALGASKQAAGGAMIQDKRSYVAARYGLYLGPNMAGWLHGMEGGSAYADVVNEKTGPDHFVKKHIAGVKYEDITLECGADMEKELYQWIAETLQHKYSRKDGAVSTADYNLKETNRLLFFKALVTEVGFPALDATAKDAAKLTIKIAPELTKMGDAGAGKTASFQGKIQKKWLPANFRLKIAGLEDACSRVSKVEAITIKQTVMQDTVGEARDYQKEPGQLEFPNLVVTLPASRAKPFYDWHQTFVIQGKCQDTDEKNGTLDFLTPNLEVLFTLKFSNLGIFKISSEGSQSGDAIPRVKAEMYCERMELLFGPTPA